MYFSPLMPFTAVKPGAKITGAYLGEESEMAIRNKKYLEETRRGTVSTISAEDIANVKSKYHVQMLGIVEAQTKKVTSAIGNEDSRQFEMVGYDVHPTTEE